MQALRIQTALALIYPPRCLTCGTVVDSDFGLCGPCWRETEFIGGALCDACGIPLPGQQGGDALGCDSCLTAPPLWVQGRSAVKYRGNGRKLALALKHGDRQEIARPAASWMAQAIGPLLPENTLIVPVPLHWTRMLKRRYNQSALLAKALSKQLALPSCPDALVRRRPTGSLDGLGRAERYASLEGAIKVSAKRRAQLLGRSVLLVDDVMTSGATFHTCAQALQAAGITEIRTIALARALKDT